MENNTVPNSNKNSQIPRNVHQLHDVTEECNGIVITGEGNSVIRWENNIIGMSVLLKLTCKFNTVPFSTEVNYRIWRAVSKIHVELKISKKSQDNFVKDKVMVSLFYLTSKCVTVINRQINQRNRIDNR